MVHKRYKGLVVVAIRNKSLWDVHTSTDNVALPRVNGKTNKTCGLFKHKRRRSSEQCNIYDCLSSPCQRNHSR